MATASGDDWISRPEARRRLAIGRVTFNRLISQGRLTIRFVPGGRPAVRASEVDDLAERSTRRATAERGATTCA